MSTDPTSLNHAGTKPKVHFGPRAEQVLKLYEKEIGTYLRELPRLLAEGMEGQHLLIKGPDILSIWKTDAEAIRAGREKFGVEPIFVKKIDRRDIERFSLLDLGKDVTYWG